MQTIYHYFSATIKALDFSEGPNFMLMAKTWFYTKFRLYLGFINIPSNGQTQYTLLLPAIWLIWHAVISLLGAFGPCQ